MIPQTFAAFLAFLMLVAPGVVWQILRERHGPALAESTFREASRVALTSLVFTSASILVLWLLCRIGAFVTLDTASWLDEGKRYAVAHIGLITRTMLLQLAVALTITVAVDWLFHGPRQPSSAWEDLFSRAPRGSTPWIHVRLKDETEAWGYLASYTADTAAKVRELTLTGPAMQYRRKGQDQNTSLDKWAAIVVRDEDVSWLKVQYVDEQGTINIPAQRSGASILWRALRGQL